MKLIKFIGNWFKKNKPALEFVLKVFLIWQLVVFLISASGSQAFPSTGRYLYTEKRAEVGEVSPDWFWNRANFDGIHYLSIARLGYGLHQQAFFPFYPKLINWLSLLFGRRELLTALFISAASLFGALFFLNKLFRLDYSKKTSRKALIYLLIFPTAFFFANAYTESLFLFLVVASFYFARTRKWLLAGILGGLAANTRLPGIFLFPALWVEFAYQRKLSDRHTFKKWLSLMKERIMARRAFLKRHLSLVVGLCSLLFIPLGLFSYMSFLKVNYQDPLLFVHVQKYFGAERSSGKIILLYQVFWRYLKMIITCEKLSLLYFTVWLEVLTAILFLALLIFGWYRKIRPSYLVFGLFSFLTPTLTGTFSSLPRYVLVIFPCFLALALLEKEKKFKKPLRIYFFLSLVLFFVCQVLFFRGFWVS